MSTARISAAAVGETATAADLPQTINEATLRTNAASNCAGTAVPLFARMPVNAIAGTAVHNYTPSPFSQDTWNAWEWYVTRPTTKKPAHPTTKKH